MKKKNITPKSRIRQSLRKLWLQSRERAATLKRDNYTCVCCNKKQSNAKGKEFKVLVHHKEEINWDQVLELIQERILQSPDKLETLCEECHNKKHKRE